MPAVARAPVHTHGRSSKATSASSSITRNNVGAAINGLSDQHQDTGTSCSNPFRIPRHASRTGLRNVPQLIRERLPRVSFGKKICTSCRHRVYTMLKERKHLKPSTRGLQQQQQVGGNKNGSLDRRRSEQPPRSQPQLKSRRSEPVKAAAISTASSATTTTTTATNASVKKQQPVQVMMTVTATTEADARAIQSLFEADEQSTSSGESVPVGSGSGASNAVSNLEVESSALLDHAMSRRSRPQQAQRQLTQQQQALIQPDPGLVKQICCFCGLAEDNEVQFGKFYQHNGIVTHYYCLLLSSNMEQKGNDDEGILGFLADDIQKEIKRGKRLVCSYCRKNGATLGCCNAKCKRIFHFPCGLKAGSLHQFFGEFRSYCINHRPKQKIDERVKKEIENMKNILCYICYEDVTPLDGNGTLWAPCCKKNAWFHRNCVQTLAMSAGYFFKCPLCNNKREFQTAMLEYGIYIPRQDASWELVPNAFEELLYRHDRCDAATCLCPKGRTYTSNNAKWELALCRMCGSQGTHLFCGQLKWVNPVWDCNECLAILKKPAEGAVTTDSSTSNSNEIPTQRENTTLNVTIRECDEDSDSDISVGNESLPLESNLTNIPTILPQIKLRPGPRSFKLQQVQKLQSSSVEANEEITNQISKVLDNSNTPVNNAASNGMGMSRVSASHTKVSSEVICIESDEEAVEIVCESIMRTTIRNRRPLQFSNTNGACSSNSSNLSSPMIHHIDLASPKATKVVPAPVENDECPFNIIISNVTSVPAEFFASVPEQPDEEESEQQMAVESLSTVATMATTNNLKRHHPFDEENECLIVDEGPKRARLESEIAANPSIQRASTTLEPAMTRVVQAEADGGLMIAKIDTVGPPLLANIKQSPSKVAEAATTTAALAGVGASGASSSLESCHGDAGTSTAMVDTSRSYGQDRAEPEGSAAFVAAVAVNGLPESHAASPDTNTHTSAPVDPELNIRTVLENGSSSHCSSSGGSGGSSKSRNSSGDRSGLIPDYVRLSDLKFKICGSDLELSYRACKIQLKLNGMHSNSTTLTDASNAATASVSQFAGSNQNLSSEKSSKSFHLRSDDSDGSYRMSKSLRARSLRSFVYEDDNTLLEYPTSANDTHNNAKKTSLATDRSIARLNRNDLKENWDPEVSSSSNNTFDNANNNNNQANSADLKDGNVNNRDKSSKNDDNGFSQSQKEETGNVQRLLRRSNRIVRHFRSVQQSNNLNGQLNGDSSDSSTNNFSPSFGKSNHTSMSDQSVRSSRSLKVLNSSDATEQQNKHLKNVDINDLSFTLTTGKLNGTHNNNDADSDADFKVSIDLQKISNLISAKPDLFFKTKNNGVKRLHVYSVDEKLRVEFVPGEKKFLTKSQSFDCLLNVAKDDLSYFSGRSRSLDNLSNIDSNDMMPLTDKKDCMERKTRRSQRRKTRQFEKPECVR